MATEAPKIITATPADIRAYFAFRAFQNGDEYLVLGKNPFSRDISSGSFHPVDRAGFLRFDQAMEAWRTGGRKLVSKGYLFSCDCGYGNGKHDNIRTFEPPGEPQNCYECGDQTGYDSIPAIGWSAEQLLSDPEARETDIDIDFLFNKKPDGYPFRMDFVNEYFSFIGANLKDLVSDGGHVHVYHVTMKPTDAPRIEGTEGLIAEMEFRGKDKLFLPE
ncbi:MAG TPA: hypothetical protein VJA47_06240 [archaeon]|nr:hypothetical protein [archaeon]